MSQATMTIKELADSFGVSKEAILKHVRELYPDEVEHGKATELDIYQVTEIKKRMQQTTLVVSAKTELEIMQGGLEYLQWLQSKIQQQTLQIAEMEPKAEFYDTITTAEDCFSMSETVRLLKLTIGRNKFYALLKAEKILKQSKEPYQEYIDAGYFKTILKQVGHGELRS